MLSGTTRRLTRGNVAGEEILVVFVGLIFVVVGLIHFYLWKRLVKDTLPP